MKVADVDPRVGCITSAHREVVQQETLHVVAPTGNAAVGHNSLSIGQPASDGSWQRDISGVRGAGRQAVIQDTLLAEPVDDVGAAWDVRGEAVVEQGNRRILGDDTSVGWNGIAQVVSQED